MRGASGAARRLQLLGRCRRRVGSRRRAGLRSRVTLWCGVGARLRTRIGRRLRRLARLALGLALGRVGGIEPARAGAHRRPIAEARDLAETRNVALLAAAFGRTKARRVLRIAVEHRPHQQRVRSTVRRPGRRLPGRPWRATPPARRPAAGAQEADDDDAALQSSSPGSRCPLRPAARQESPLRSILCTDGRRPAGASPPAAATRGR